MIKKRSVSPPITEKPAHPAGAPTLFLFARNDIPSMNPGRAAAQLAHAANQCVFDVRARGNKDHKEMLADWEDQAGGFGTTLTIVGPWLEINRCLADHLYGRYVFGDTISDPSYPVLDGAITHLVNINTAAYLLARGTYLYDIRTRYVLDLMP